MLVVVNPNASSVNARLRNLIIYALESRFEVDSRITDAPRHAIEIAREAATANEHDIITVLGGDGTLNEVANGMAGTGTKAALAVLPGGAANVVAKTVGIPSDLIDATEHLLSLGDRFEPHPIDLGVAGERRYLFAAGAGLDASAANRVDSHPKLKAKGGRWFYTSAAVYSFYRDYLLNPVKLRASSGGLSAEGVTAIAQNSSPFTYFGERPIDIIDGLNIGDGSFALAVLRRASQLDMPSVIVRAFSPNLKLSKHRAIAELRGLSEAVIESTSYDEATGELRGFPVQVDGDFIGVHTRLELSIEPAALNLLY